MDASVGIQFGRYLLRQRLGVGGMASVWRAVDDTGRALVVKRILPCLQSDAEFVAMFDREATLSARLLHPNVVHVVDHGSYEGERYLAMEELHGRDLGTAMMELTRAAGPSAGLGAFVARELGRALAYVHALSGDDGAPLGVMHRDVSLSNVMLGFDGTVKLLDFGVAKAIAAQHSQRTQTGVLKGKWGYLAPEQIEGGEVDQRADLFALGVVLWEVLTGRRLFKAATGLETLEKVRAARVPAPSTVNPAVPPALDAICLRALARTPSDRFASAAEMAAALDRVVGALGFGARELQALMARLFSAEAEVFAESQQTTPVHRVALDVAALDAAPPRAHEPSPRSLASAHAPSPARDDDDTLLSPAGTTLDALRRVRPSPLRARTWRLLIAAVVAAVLGGLTGWQISQARAGHRAPLSVSR